jgi:hypothetical protein
LRNPGTLSEFRTRRPAPERVDDRARIRERQLTAPRRFQLIEKMHKFADFERHPLGPSNRRFSIEGF